VSHAFGDDAERLLAIAVERNIQSTTRYDISVQRLHFILFFMTVLSCHVSVFAIVNVIVNRLVMNVSIHSVYHVVSCCVLFLLFLTNSILQSSTRGVA
jgi:hypothetical protein